MTYRVKPDWRERGIWVQAATPFFAVAQAVNRDARLAPFTYGGGMSQQDFDWGTRFERNQVCVDVEQMKEAA